MKMRGYVVTLRSPEIFVEATTRRAAKNNAIRILAKYPGTWLKAKLSRTPAHERRLRELDKQMRLPKRKRDPALIERLMGCMK